MSINVIGGLIFLEILSSYLVIQEIMIRKPNQVRGGEHDVPIQDDSFKKFHQMLANLTEMEEKHQVCVCVCLSNRYRLLNQDKLRVELALLLLLLLEIKSRFCSRNSVNLAHLG